MNISALLMLIIKSKIGINFKKYIKSAHIVKKTIINSQEKEIYFISSGFDEILRYVP
jgi:hypothetical protein